MKKFGARLQAIRKKSGITQDALAAEFNTYQSMISLYEKGIKAPDMEFMLKFANKFEVSIDRLVSGEDNSHIETTTEYTAEHPEKYEVIDAVDRAFLDDWKSLSEVERMRVWTILKETKEQNKVHGGGLREVS